MADIDTLRRLALALPGAVETSEGERLAFSVGGKGFVWSYRARLAPKGPKALVPECVAIPAPLERKELLTEAAPEIFFDDAHYRGYPAVLVRLPQIGDDELTALLRAAWDIQVRKLPAKTRRALLEQAQPTGDIP